jgi:hypothetical protein
MLRPSIDFAKMNHFMTRQMASLNVCVEDRDSGVGSGPSNVATDSAGGPSWEKTLVAGRVNCFPGRLISEA